MVEMFVGSLAPSLRNATSCLIVAAKVETPALSSAVVVEEAVQTLGL